VGDRRRDRGLWPSYFEMGRLAGQSIDQIKGKAPSTLPILRATHSI
jgi:hypothetical protein